MTVEKSANIAELIKLKLLFFTDCNYIECLLTVVFMILSAFIMLNVIKACT